MISLIAFLGTVLLGITVSENEITGIMDVELNNSTPVIQHSGFSSEDKRQLMVQKAYNLWGLDFVLMLECENGNRNPKAVWDGGHSYGLCQMNNRWHNIPSEYYNDWKFQLEYCYKKWNTWTKFYWPSRNIHGTKCSTYVRDRFILS